MMPKTPQTPTALLTKREAGLELRITERTVHALIRKGLLPAVRFGGTVRIDPADLRAFIEGQKTKAVAHV